MNMPDNEVDELFRSQLSNLDVAPSSKVWRGINKEIAFSERKRRIPFLGIAASILLITAAAAVLILKTISLADKHPIATNKPIPRPIGKPLSPPPTFVKDGSPSILFAASGTAHHHNPSALSYKRSVKSKLITGTTTKAIQAVVPELASGNTHSAETNDETYRGNPVVPDVNTQIIVKSNTEANSTPKENPSIIASNQPPTAPLKNEPARPRHKIRNIGDFLNVVIAKVDKRKDKVIEFTDTDDDEEANVTGVNLGIIKIKRDK